MTVSRLRSSKTETRDLADRERVWGIASRIDLADPIKWQMSNGTFFGAFVAIAAVLAVFALVVR